MASLVRYPLPRPEAVEGLPSRIVGGPLPPPPSIGYKVHANTGWTAFDHTGANYLFYGPNTTWWVVAQDDSGSDWFLWEWDGTTPTSFGDTGGWAKADLNGGGNVNVDGRDSARPMVWYEAGSDELHVFSQHSTERYNLYSYNSGTNDWTHDVTDETTGVPNIDGGIDASMAVDGNGKVWVVYEDDSANTLRTGVRANGIGGTWASGAVIETGATTDSGATRAALKPWSDAGTPSMGVAYSYGFSGGDKWQFAYRADSDANGLAWTKEEIDATTTIDDHIQLAAATFGADSGDTIIVVAKDGSTDLVSWRRTAAGSWQSPVTLESGNGSRPQVVIDTSNAEVYAFFHDVDSSAKVLYKTADPTTTLSWSASQTALEAAGAQMGLDCTVAASGLGTGTSDLLVMTGMESPNGAVWWRILALAAGATNLVIADALHAHAADNIDLTQVHELVIQEAAHAHAGDNVVLTQDHQLVIAEAAHAHAADSLVLTQLHKLTIAEAAHANLADNIDLTQVHELVIAEAAHAHAADNVVLTQDHQLVIAEAAHAHAADNLDLTQLHKLVIAEAAHAHAADSLVLTVAHNLVIAEAAHAHAADNLVLTQVHELVIAEAAHAHLADNVVLSIATTLVIAEAAHAQAADNLVLTQVHELVIAEAAHAHAADNLTLTQLHKLVIAEALHAHAADNLDLTQDHQLVIAEAAHAHAADNIDLTQVHELVIAEAAHAHVADNLVLTQVHKLTIAEALHAHAADNLVLTTGAVDLVIAEALHAHAADNLALTQLHQLVIAEAAHAHAADNLALTQVHQLVVAEALHAHIAENAVLTANVEWFVDPEFDLGCQANQADGWQCNNGATITGGEGILDDEGASEHLATRLHVLGTNPPAANITVYFSVRQLSSGSGVRVRTNGSTLRGQFGQGEHSLTYAASGGVETLQFEIIAGFGTWAISHTSTIGPETVPLTIADALNAHAADNLTLGQDHNLTVGDGLHGHQADTIALTQVHDLVVAAAAHAHAADNIDLTLILPDTLGRQAVVLRPVTLSSILADARDSSLSRATQKSDKH